MIGIEGMVKKTMKKVVILTEDDYAELRRAILDAMYDYQHTRGGICKRLQKAIDILDGKDGKNHDT